MGGSGIPKLIGSNIEVLGSNLVGRSGSEEVGDCLGGLVCSRLRLGKSLILTNIDGRATDVIIGKGVTSSA